MLIGVIAVLCIMCTRKTAKKGRRETRGWEISFMNEWPSPRMAREEGPRLSPTSVEVEAYLNELQDSDRWSPPRDERRYETHQFTPNWMRQRLNEPDPKDSLVVHKHSPRVLGDQQNRQAVSDIARPASVHDIDYSPPRAPIDSYPPRTPEPRRSQNEWLHRAEVLCGTRDTPEASRATPNNQNQTMSTPQPIRRAREIRTTMYV